MDVYLEFFFLFLFFVFLFLSILAFLRFYTLNATLSRYHISYLDLFGLSFLSSFQTQSYGPYHASVRPFACLMREVVFVFVLCAACVIEFLSVRSLGSSQ